MLYAFNDADAPGRHETQYFEVFVNRGVYHNGWTAVTRHSTPWASGEQLPALDDDVWELYAPDDWTQVRDIAKKEPDRLRALQRLFLIEAAKYNVLPLDDRKFERFNSDLAGRPQLLSGNTQMLFGGMGRLSENSVLNLKNKSFAITADVNVAGTEASGVIVAQGGRFGGWTFYVHNGKPRLLLQPPGHHPVYLLRRHTAHTRRSPGPDGVRLRRWRTGEGRHGQPVRRWATGWPGSGRRHPTDDLLRRRDDRCGCRHRHARQR